MRGSYFSIHFGNRVDKELLDFRLSERVCYEGWILCYVYECDLYFKVIELIMELFWLLFCLYFIVIIDRE